MLIEMLDDNKHEKRMAYLEIPREYMPYLFRHDWVACHLSVEYEYDGKALDPGKFKIVGMEHIHERDVFRFLVESEELHIVQPGISLCRIDINVTAWYDFGRRMSELHKVYEEMLEQDKLYEIGNLVERADQ